MASDRAWIITCELSPQGVKTQQGNSNWVLHFLVALLVQRVPHIRGRQVVLARWAVDNVLALHTQGPELNAHESHKKASPGGICSWCWGGREGQMSVACCQVVLACLASSRLMRVSKIKMSDAWGMRTKLSLTRHIHAHTQSSKGGVFLFVCFAFPCRVSY